MGMGSGMSSTSMASPSSTGSMTSTSPSMPASSTPMYNAGVQNTGAMASVFGAVFVAAAALV